MTTKTIRQQIQGGLDARTPRPALAVVPSAPATPWMDSVGAAEYTGFTADALKQMRYLGTGPAYSKPAGRVRYHRDDLETFMREGRRSA
ncbi:MAG: helix-turn-helix domain-containing protein [Brachybacterium tyrofermentans]|uniref:helix-turn-helix domain-containing protein n=1 Tax=Brachybacterium tyrofermentans TaxID=47848 RepID=UPI001868F245|nr:helix-turn-helix domain-containing protein [Brachybacterium tyrofermentans]